MNGQHRAGSSSANRLPAFSAGLLLGGLAGAVAMLLWAPRTGKQTCSKIQKQGAKLRDQAADGMHEVVIEVGDKAHQVTDAVHKGVGDLQQQAQEMFGG